MESENVFRILLAALFLSFMLHRGYYHRKMEAPDEDTIVRQQGGRLSRFANLLSLPGLFGAALYVIDPAWMSWSAIMLPVWLRGSGVVAAATGFVLLQWAQQTLGRSWSGEPRMMKRQRLVTGGPYRWIRHPIYTAFLLILGSPLLISANWFIGGFWLGIVSLDVLARIRVEEAMMLDHFGEEYRTYMRSTGRLIPRL